MACEFHYRVNAFEVVLTESDEAEVHPFEATSCECEDYHKKLTHPSYRTIDDQRCRHIREAILYHHFASKVEPVDSRQESLTAFTTQENNC